MKSGIFKFYCTYVNDISWYTLVLIKVDQTDKISKAFNSFHNNLRFTVDKSENEDVPFMNIYVKIPIVVYI